MCSSRCCHFFQETKFQSSLVPIGCRIDICGRILRVFRFGQSSSGSLDVCPHHRRIGFQVFGYRTYSDVGIVVLIFELNIAYIGRPSGGASYFRYTAFFSVFIQNFKVVDVHLIIINHTVVLTRRGKAHIIYIPNQFHRQGRSGLFFYLGNNAFRIDLGRSRSLSVIAQFQFTHHNFIIFCCRRTFYPETDIFDLITLINSRKSNFFFFPFGSCKITHRKFQPVFVIEFSQNEIQVGSVLTFYPRFNSNLGFRISGSHVQ